MMSFKSTPSYSNKLTTMRLFNCNGITKSLTLIKGSQIQLDSLLWKDVWGYKFFNSVSVES